MEEADSPGSGSEQRLLERARLGNHAAVHALFDRYRSWLRRWARGRLPRHVRGAIDTSDLVQDTLSHTFARFTSFRSTQARALRIYLRRAVENRIRDELRRATRRQSAVLPDEPVRASDAAAPQLRELINDQTWRRYLDALQRLPDRDRRLVVARAELGCSSKQLAFLERLSSPAVARVALRRALIRLGNLMSDA